jgi:hypothetical protein
MLKNDWITKHDIAITSRFNLFDDFSIANHSVDWLFNT